METLDTRQPPTRALFDGTSASDFHHETKEEDKTFHRELSKDEFDLLEMNLPGLCQGDDDSEQIALESSQYRAAADAVSRQNLKTELLKQVREQPWFSQRHLAYQNHHLPSHRRSSINEESFSYAKALVDDDAELERFSKEISSQLHLTEMMEVAVRAQQAADEGCETFSASMASYVPQPTLIEEGRSDAEAGEQQQHHHNHHHNGPIVTSLESNSGEPSQTTAPFRHIAEVIPNFETMNSHMRTHLYRKKVDKKTLVFKEVQESERRIEHEISLSPRSQGTEITADFFKNLSGYFGKRVRSSENGAQENAGRSTDETDLEEPHFPLDLTAPSAMPSVGSLASLNSLAVKPSQTVPELSFEDDEWGGDGEEEGETSLTTPPPSPIASSSSIQDPKDVMKETMEILNTVSSSTGPTETDHGSIIDHDGSHSSCPSSPFENLGDRTPLPSEIMQPIQQEDNDDDDLADKTADAAKLQDYNTPKRLRVLRQSDGGEQQTPDPHDPRLNFSPSSIIASSVGPPSSVGREERESAFLKEHARLLEIPRIGEKPPSETGDLTPSPTIEDVAEKAKRTRRIRMLRRRLENEDNFSSHETGEGNVNGSGDEQVETKTEDVDKNPMFDQNTNVTTPQESSVVSLVPRPQPEEALVYLPEKEEKSTTVSTLCGPDKACLIDATTNGIPSILPKSSWCGDDKQYFKESKNDEYMNNYFYLSRFSDHHQVERQNYRRFICDETIDRTGVLCQDVGTTCTDLDINVFLGSNNNNNNDGGQRKKANARAMASQAPYWLTQLGFGFMYGGGSAEKKTPSHL